MTKNGILCQLVEAIREVSPITEELLPAHNADLLDKNTNLVELGINSIDYVEIIAVMENSLNINTSLDFFEGTNNINEIVSILHNVVCEKESSTTATGT